MTKRLYTVTELDAHQPCAVDVDCDEGFFQDAVLTGVYKDGRFDIALADGKTHMTVGPIHNGMTKVFLA
jgi:hypothetical protein